MEITGGSNCWEARRKVVNHLEVYEESNDVRTPEHLMLIALLRHSTSDLFSH